MKILTVRGSVCVDVQIGQRLYTVEITPDSNCYIKSVVYKGEIPVAVGQGYYVPYLQVLFEQILLSLGIDPEEGVHHG